MAASDLREDAESESAIARNANAGREHPKGRNRVCERARDEHDRPETVVRRQRVDQQLEPDRERERLVRVRPAERCEVALAGAAGEDVAVSADPKFADQAREDPDFDPIRREPGFPA